MLGNCLSNLRIKEAELRIRIQLLKTLIPVSGCLYPDLVCTLGSSLIRVLLFGKVGSDPVNLSLESVNLYPDPVNLYPDPVNLYPDPVNLYAVLVNLYPDPVNMYPDPVNLYPDPVNLYPDPVNLYTDPVKLNPYSKA